ncbi:MAG: Brp/Blh family beta-carotene 15,15'-dioxygenase [Bacteroidales bacterium]
MLDTTLQQQLRQPRIWALIMGIILVLIHQLAGEVKPAIDYIFFAIFVILIGIPHGAVDHLVEEKYFQKKKKPFSLFRFLFKYILQIAAYAILWFFMPVLSLTLFLVLSAWHFGESDMQPAPRHLLWKVSQMLLGTLVLFFILMREPAFTADLIFRITRESMPALNSWQWAAGNSLAVYGVLLVSLILISVIAQRFEPLKWQPVKWINFVLLLTVIYFLPLLPAFALYFGGWHSLNTFDHMSEFLGDKNSVWRLWKAALPFTLLAIFFLGLTALLWSGFLNHIDPLPILFIFIAVITLPHLLVMNKMFSER